MLSIRFNSRTVKNVVSAPYPVNLYLEGAVKCAWVGSIFKKRTLYAAPDSGFHRSGRSGGFWLLAPQGGLIAIRLKSKSNCNTTKLVKQ
jgi:hypothetical protein